MTAPILKYPGAKWRLAPRILSYLPAHRRYLEPFGGSAAILLSKPPARHEIYNDLDGEVVNLFRQIRERGAALAAAVEMTPWARAEYDASFEPAADPLEAARRFLVRTWQSHGSGGGPRTRTWRHKGAIDASIGTCDLWCRLPARLLAVVERMRLVEIEQRPALDIIARYATPDTLIYADPPYPRATRSGRLYSEDGMTDADHVALLDALDAHPGPVALSGYACPLYDSRLARWQRVDLPALAEKGQGRTESLWLNAAAQDALGYGPLFDMEAA